MVGASPSFLPFPMVVALTVTLGAEGGGQTMIVVTPIRGDHYDLPYWLS